MISTMQYFNLLYPIGVLSLESDYVFRHCLTLLRQNLQNLLPKKVKISTSLLAGRGN